MDNKGFEFKVREEVEAVEALHLGDPRHLGDKRQVHTASGVGVGSILSVLGLEAFDFVGEHVAEIVGGGSGVGLIIFFLFKFFSVELEELSDHGHE